MKIEWQKVSEPGAVIEVWTAEIPPEIQARIAAALDSRPPLGFWSCLLAWVKSRLIF